MVNFCLAMQLNSNLGLNSQSNDVTLSCYQAPTLTIETEKKIFAYSTVRNIESSGFFL